MSFSRSLAFHHDVRDLLRARVQVLAARRARAEDFGDRFEALFQFSRLRGFELGLLRLLASSLRLRALSFLVGRVLVPRRFIKSS